MSSFWRRKKDDSSSVLGLDLSIEELKAREEAADQTLSTRFSDAVRKTRAAFSDGLDSLLAGGRAIDEKLFDELEELLISSDLGVPVTVEALEMLRTRLSRNELKDGPTLKSELKKHLREILADASRKGIADESSTGPGVKPYVMMIVGVNGVGKTTTIGKLAQRIKSEGNNVMVCAADTFRAAANDQLEIWAGRTGVEIIQQKQGTDPAAVLFDSLKAARARDIDVLIIDTAGRLHNKLNLMAELEKMNRIAGREIQGAPHETLLVIDAVTGQNGLEQARQFAKTTSLTGIVLTKLDGTAKGGIAVAISKELGLPIRYVGVGESVEDLLVFDPDKYLDGLLG